LGGIEDIVGRQISPSNLQVKVVLQQNNVNYATIHKTTPQQDDEKDMPEFLQ